MRFEMPAERAPIFPAMCLCCGRAAEVERKLSVSRLVARGQGQETVQKQYAVQLCGRCARADSRVAVLSWGSVLLGMVLITVGTFVALLFAQGVLYRSGINLGVGEVINERGNDLILFGFIAFIVGVIGGGVVEALVKVLGIPFFGRTLLWAPFALTQIFSDTSYVAGLTGALSKDGRQVHLRFFNPGVAQAFARENNLKPVDA